MSKIVLLRDVYELKEQKEKELKFYKEKLTELQDKMYWVERELKLTKDIIRMIEDEKITKLESNHD